MPVTRWAFFLRDAPACSAGNTHACRSQPVWPCSGRRPARRSQGEAPMALNGTNGDDEFRGTSFADEIFGFGGNDYITCSPGADTINGGSDVDTVDYLGFSPHIPLSGFRTGVY